MMAPLRGGAYETDQFSNRLEPIADSTGALDQIVNQSIDDAATGPNGTRSERWMVDAIYHDIGGHHWVDKIERWAMDSGQVERLQPDRSNSIYSGHPIWATRVAKVFGVGPTIKVNDTLIGSDKLGHFLSQGRKYYRRYLKSFDEAEAAEHSAYTERALFGQMTTGSYSNADLVANYEGYRFYRSLFEDDIIPGKPAILAWKNGRQSLRLPALSLHGRAAQGVLPGLLAGAGALPGRKRGRAQGAVCAAATKGYFGTPARPAMP